MEALYDALHAFESPRYGGLAYPVHKKLIFEDSASSDIYDWIIDRVEIADGGAVLDAGCGVGFGTMRLAQRSSCRVTGISLSRDEILAASKMAQQSGLAERVSFQQASFDDLSPGMYDLVVAVESLKHSGDLPRSLSSMVRSLKPRGQIVIVDDFCTRDEGPRGGNGRQLANDWHLAGLFTESEHLDILGAANCALCDLTDRVRKEGRLALAIRLALFDFLGLFARGKSAIALRAFRGGFRLAKMYADGEMAYKAIVFRQGDRARR